MTDTVLEAFFVFFTQSPSFLSYQQDMEKRTGQSNANTLFSMGQIPTDNQIRNILDEIDPESFMTVFDKAFKGMIKAKILLTSFRVTTRELSGYNKGRMAPQS